MQKNNAIRCRIGAFVLSMALLGCHSSGGSPVSEEECPTQLLNNLRLLRAQNLAGLIPNDSLRVFLANNEATLLNHAHCLDPYPADLLDTLGKASKGEDQYFFFKFSLQLRHRYLPLDHLNISRMWYNLGLYHQLNSQTVPALNYFDSIGVYGDKESIPRVLALIKTGYTYNSLNEFPAASKAFGEAYDSCKRDLSSPYKANSMPELLQHYSDCTRHLRQFSKAIRLANEGLALNPASLLSANLYLNLGNAWQDSLNSLPVTAVQARNNTREAATIATRTAFETYQMLEENESARQAACNLGELYRRSGQPTLAIKTFTTAINAPGDGNSLLLAELYLDRGEALANLNQDARALADYDTALYHLVPAYRLGSQQLPDFEGLGLEAASDLLLLLGDRARAHLALGGGDHRAAALNEYRALIRLTEQQRSALVSDEAKIALAGESQGNLRQAFQLALQVGDTRQAFSIAEQSKAVLLLEQLRRRNQRTRLDATALRQLDERQRVDQELEALNRRMFLNRERPDSMSLLNEWWRQAFARKTALSQQTQTASPTATAETSVQSLLAPDQALLEYVCLDSVVHIFVVKRDTFCLVSQRVPANFSQCCTTLDWSALVGLKDAEREFLTCLNAHQLYQWLIQPVAHLLPERLVVVPDAALQSVPFETLLVQAPSAGQGIREQGKLHNFLIFNKVISYSYSANLLREMQQVEVPQQRRHGLAGLAPGFPEQLIHAEAQVLPKAIEEVLPTLRPLQNQQELAAIGEQVCLRSYTGALASKSQFFAACRDAVAVHVATHGILNDAEPERNFVAFHQDSAVVNPDEFLYLSELAEHDPLQLDLAVFSACETARGRYLQGEGTMSMARALAAAGVRTVVTTLWPVRTTQQARLMPVFYEQMAQKGGLEKDRALALAKRDFIENSSAHPADWAGAVLIGATNVLELPATCPNEGPLWPKVLLAVALATLLLALWRRWRRVVLTQ